MVEVFIMGRIVCSQSFEILFIAMAEVGHRTYMVIKLFGDIVEFLHQGSNFVPIPKYAVTTWSRQEIQLKNHSRVEVQTRCLICK